MELVARGLVLTVAVLFLVSMVVFALLNLPPGDPALAILGDQPWVEELRALQGDLGPDRPFFVRYLIWLGRVVLRVVS